MIRKRLTVLHSLLLAMALPLAALADTQHTLTIIPGDDMAAIPAVADLFDVLSLGERAGSYDDDIPDVITVFKGPHERCFDSREEIVEEVGKTIIHELGHYFGLTEEQLAAMGYE